MHVVDVIVVLIQRVSVHGELNSLDKLLSKVGNVSDETSSVVSVIGSDLSESDVENHIMEEVTKLRDGKLNFLSQSSRSGLNTDLVVLVTDCGERLKMRVHKENVSSLDIHQGRCRILNLRVSRPHALDVEQALVQELRR